jgi:hypothetical protein
MTTNYEIKIYNCETGEEIVRAMTTEEIEIRKQDEANSIAQKAEAAAKAAQKAALLERLGITEDEARLLLA